MTSSVLTEEILEQPHTAAEYLRWVRELISRVKAEPDGIERIRLRKGLAKELMNEAFPIGLLASTYYGASEQVSIRLKVGNQNYDAAVSDCRNGFTAQHIEVTLASDGEDDYLRMRVLHESGEVSGLGSVRKSGTHRTGLNIRVDREAISQTEILRREGERLARAIERKLGKAYPHNTVLLIGFDDVMAFDRADNITNLEATVARYLPRLNEFEAIAIVGLEQGLFRSWGTASAV